MYCTPIMCQPLFSVQFSSVAQSCLTLCDPMIHCGFQVQSQKPAASAAKVGVTLQCLLPPHSLCPILPPSGPSPHAGGHPGWPGSLCNHQPNLPSWSQARTLGLSSPCCLGQETWLLWTKGMRLITNTRSSGAIGR